MKRIEGATARSNSSGPAIEWIRTVRLAGPGWKRAPLSHTTVHRVPADAVITGASEAFAAPTGAFAASNRACAR